jgi:hypothetical protein
MLRMPDQTMIEMQYRRAKEEMLTAEAKLTAMIEGLPAKLEAVREVRESIRRRIEQDDPTVGPAELIVLLSRGYEESLASDFSAQYQKCKELGEEWCRLLALRGPTT